MKKRIDSAILLCAGLGTRLRPITNTVPKPLVPLMGIPLLQYHFDLLNRYGFKRVVLNVHHLADEFVREVRGLDCGQLEVEWSDERALLLDSGGGIRTAAEVLKEEAFVTLNGDVFFDVDLDALCRFYEKIHRKDAKAMVISVRHNPSAERYREVSVDSGTSRVTSLGEKIGHGLYFAGAMALSYSQIRPLPVSQPFEFVKSILQPAISSGHAYAIESSGLWLDLGSPDLVFRAHFDLMRAIENQSTSIAARAVRANRRLGPMQWVQKNAILSEGLQSSPIPFYVSGDHSQVLAPKHPIVSYERVGFDPSRSVLSYAGHSIPCDGSRLGLS